MRKNMQTTLTPDSTAEDAAATCDIVRSFARARASDKVKQQNLLLTSATGSPNRFTPIGRPRNGKQLINGKFRAQQLMQRLSTALIIAMYVAHAAVLWFRSQGRFAEQSPIAPPCAPACNFSRGEDRIYR